MKKFLALGLTAGLLAVEFSSLSVSPAEACHYSSNQDRRAQARAIRRYEQEMAWRQYQNQYPANFYAGAQYPPNFYAGSQYPYQANSYPVDYSGYYPPALDYASYYPQAGYSPSYPTYPGTGLNAGLNAGLGGGLMQGLLSLF